MARKRMIDPTIWEDPSFNKLSLPARLLFIGMVSNADDEGYIRADAGSLRRLIFGFDDNIGKEDVAVLVVEMRSIASIHFYTVDGEDYAHFTKWSTYQKLQKDRIQSSLYPMCSKCVADDVQVPTQVSIGKSSLGQNSVGKGSAEGKTNYPSQSSGSVANADKIGITKARNAITQAKMKQKPLGILVLILAFLLLGQPIQAKAPDKIVVRYTISTPSTSHNLRPKVKLVARGDGGRMESWRPSSTPIPTPTPSPRPEQRGEGVGTKARVLAIAKERFGEKHVASFEALVQHESGFRPDAVNPSSGACGLGQALPCSKMPCELTDVDCQANWMLDYVERRYGTPNDAWYFWNHKAPNYDFNGDGQPDGHNWY